MAGSVSSSQRTGVAVDIVVEAPVSFQLQGDWRRAAPSIVFQRTSVSPGATGRCLDVMASPAPRLPIRTPDVLGIWRHDAESIRLRVLGQAAKTVQNAWCIAHLEKTQNRNMMSARGGGGGWNSSSPRLQGESGEMGGPLLC